MVLSWCGRELLGAPPPPDEEGREEADSAKEVEEVEEGRERVVEGGSRPIGLVVEEEEDAEGPGAKVEEDELALGPMRQF